MERLQFLFSPMITYNTTHTHFYTLRYQKLS